MLKKVVCVLYGNNREIVKWLFFFSLGPETNHNDILYIYKCT